MACVLIAPRVLLLGPARKSRKRANFATRQRTPNKRRAPPIENAVLVLRFSNGIVQEAPEYLCKKSWTPCGRYRRRLDKTLGQGPPHPSRTG